MSELDECARPQECTLCLESRWLHCLLNKRHPVVKDSAKHQLQTQFMKILSDPERYKIKSGEDGRKDE